MAGQNREKSTQWSDLWFDSPSGLWVLVRKKWLTAVLKYGIGIVLLTVVVYRHWEPEPAATVETAELRLGPLIGNSLNAAVALRPAIGLKSALSRPLQWHFFPLAALCLVANIALTFIRWYVLVRAQDLPFRLRDAFRLGLIGYFFNTFLPTSVGGDLLKATFIAREQKRRAVAVSTVLIDRACGLWGLVALTALSGSVYWLLNSSAIGDQPKLRQATLIAIGLVVASVLFALFMRLLPVRRAERFSQRLHSIPRIGKIFAEIWRAIWLYRSRVLPTSSALGMSILLHVFTVLGFYFAASAFQSPTGPAQMPSIFEHFLLIPMGAAFKGLFPAPGGIGGSEFAFGFLYEQVGYPAEFGILGSLGVRMLEWILGLCGYIVYLFMKNDLKSHIATDSISPDDKSTTMQVR